MHKELNIPNIRDRLEFQLSFEGFKQINIPDSSLANMFKPKEAGRITRSSNTKTMDVPNVRTNIGRRAFSYKGPNHWNSLPNDTRSIVDKNEFRRTISKLNNHDVDHPT